MTSNIKPLPEAVACFLVLTIFCFVQIFYDLIDWERHNDLNRNVLLNVLTVGVMAVLAYGAWMGSKVYYKTFFALLLFASHVYDSYRWISNDPLHGGGRLVFDLAVTAIVAIMFFGPLVNRFLSDELTIKP